MHKLIIILLTSISLYGMEECFLTKEEAQLDQESENALLINQGIYQSLEERAQWDTLPSEVKIRIFAFIPEEMKNLIFINHESYALTKDPYFLNAIVTFIIDKNLEKAVNLYAQAYEQDNETLYKALLNVHLDKKLIYQAALETTSKELSTDIHLDPNPIRMNNVEDHINAFMKAMIKLFPQAARVIFIRAAGKDISLITICLNNGIDIDLDNDYDSNDCTALMNASYYGQMAIAKLLIDKNADVNGTNKFGDSALIFAVANNHTSIVEHLLDAGAHVNARNIYGMTALMVAAKYGHVESIHVLVEYKANIEGKPYSKSEHDEHLSPLMIASLYNQEAALSSLLFYGAKINAVDKDNENALHIASFRGHNNIVKKLVEKGTLINAKNKNGLTPLMKAAIQGHLETVQLLLDLSADPNMQTKRYKKGKNALMYACIFGHVDVVEELLPVSNINAKDEHDKTVLNLVLDQIGNIDNYTIDNAQKYLKIIALLNKNMTHEGKLSKFDKFIQALCDPLDDPRLPALTAGFASLGAGLLIISYLCKKYEINLNPNDPRWTPLYLVLVAFIVAEPIIETITDQKD